MNVLQFLVKNPVSRRMLHSLGSARADDVVGKIKPLLRKDENILDLGCGLGFTLKWLRDSRYKAEGVDIRDISIYPDIRPTVYGGTVLPYKTNQFDTVLILAALHHIPDPMQVLAQAKRVGRRIIIMEDIYEGDLQKYLTFIMDSVINLEFVGHPHTNHTDREWKEVFSQLGLQVRSVKYSPYWKLFQSAIYVVEKK